LNKFARQDNALIIHLGSFRVAFSMKTNS